MNNIKYTFLLPAYKARFFEEALLSIKNQTYTDFKVIVSDDCSPEDLKSIYDKVCSDDPRFTFRRNEENMGSKSLVSHWNLLVDMCDTEFFIMASDDDVYESQFLEEIDKLTIKYPNIDLYRSGVHAIDIKGEIFESETNKVEFANRFTFIRKWYKKDFITCIANYCYRTMIVKQNNGFVSFPKAWFTDDATNIIISQKGYANTKENLFRFRKSEINISGRYGNATECAQKTLATIEFYKWINSYFDNCIINVPYSEIHELIISKIKRNINNNIFHCSLLNFIYLVYIIPDKIGLNKFRMCIHYTRILSHKI